MNPSRAMLGLIVVALAAWLGWALFVEPAPAPAQARAFTSSSQCQECHAQTYAEWESSWHAQSWTDPEVRTLSRDFSNKDCIDCHAPRPVLETGIGNRVLPRAANRVAGVDCLTCHMRPDGRIAGTIEAPAAPCRPAATRELVAPEFCAPCHDQHGTVQQWKVTAYAQPGPGFASCVDCHMPHREGDPTLGRDHTMHGGHSPELLRAAVELRAERLAGMLRVSVENVGAGHNYPTDERSRASDLFWRPLAAPGAEPGPWRHLHRFRNPYRDEVGQVNTELPYGETIHVDVDDPEAAGAVEVALFYKLSPYWTDPDRPDPEGEATLVHSLQVAP